MSTGKIELQGQLIQLVNMELFRCNARSQCRLFVDEIIVDHVNPGRYIAITWYFRETPNSLSGEFRDPSYAWYEKTITRNYSLTHGIMLGMKIPNSKNSEFIDCTALKNDNSEFFQVNQTF